MTIVGLDTFHRSIFPN